MAKRVVKKKEEAKVEKTKVSKSGLTVSGVDVDDSKSVSEGVHKAIKVAKNIKEEDRGVATATISKNGGSEDPNLNVNNRIKIKSRHQQRTENFFKECERKKKLISGDK